MKRIPSLLLLPALLPFPASAAMLRGETTRPPVSYRTGEPIEMRFTMQDAAPDGARLRWTVEKDGESEPTSGIAHVAPDGALVLTNAMDRPGFLRATATLVDADGHPLRAGGRPVSFTLGAGADVSALRNLPEPEDFDAFWAEAKREADAADLAAAEVRDAPAPFRGKDRAFMVRTFRVPLGADAAPATGWIVAPGATPEGGLPIRVDFCDYGMGGQKPEPWMHDKEAIRLLVNAHGFEPGRDAAYYRDFMYRVSNGGNRGGYGFRNAENDDPRTCYFRGMVVRDLAALRLARSLPGWNGKDLTLAGRGQGGFQAVAVAALDGGVSSCEIEAPWLCDLGAEQELGAAAGWRPAYRPALRYFDAANFAKRVRCPVDVARCGLADTTSPPSGVSVLYNQLAGPKAIRYVQDSRLQDGGPAPDGAQTQRLSSGKIEERP